MPKDIVAKRIRAREAVHTTYDLSSFFPSVKLSIPFKGAHFHTVYPSVYGLNFHS